MNTSTGLRKSAEVSWIGQIFLLFCTKSLLILEIRLQILYNKFGTGNASARFPEGGDSQ